MAEIKDDAAIALGDRLERALQLLPAVASERAKRVPGEALGVQADKHGLVTREVAAHECHDLGVLGPEDADAQFAELRWE